MFLRSLLIAATLLTALPGAQADGRHGRYADDDERGRDRERERERGDDRRDERPRREKSLEQALRETERRYNAQVISTETRRQGDRTVYRFKLLNKEGKVWWVTVDASG